MGEGRGTHSGINVITVAEKYFDFRIICHSIVLIRQLSGMVVKPMRRDNKSNISDGFCGMTTTPMRERSITSDCVVTERLHDTARHARCDR